MTMSPWKPSAPLSIGDRVMVPSPPLRGWKRLWGVLLGKNVDGGEPQQYVVTAMVSCEGDSI
jgi:hypothetical protein